MTRRARPSPCARWSICARSWAVSRRRPVICTTWRPRRRRARPSDWPAPIRSDSSVRARRAPASVPTTPTRPICRWTTAMTCSRCWITRTTCRRSTRAAPCSTSSWASRSTTGARLRRLVRSVAENYRLPYYTLTPTFSICPVHGYISGEHEYCPYDHTSQELARYGCAVPAGIAAEEDVRIQTLAAD